MWFASSSFRFRTVAVPCSNPRIDLRPVEDCSVFDALGNPERRQQGGPKQRKSTVGDEEIKEFFGGVWKTGVERRAFRRGGGGPPCGGQKLTLHIHEKLVYEIYTIVKLT